MNKVVTKQHVRASDLPDDLRGEIPASALVTVTVAEEADHAQPESDPIELLKAYRDGRNSSARTLEEIVRDIRSQRDEWG